MTVIASSSLESRQVFSHVSLISVVTFERGESRCKCPDVHSFFGGIAGKRRVHDYEVVAVVRDFGADLGGGLFAGAAGALGRVAGVEQGQDVGRLEKLQGAIITLSSVMRP